MSSLTKIWWAKDYVSQARVYHLMDWLQKHIEFYFLNGLFNEQPKGKCFKITVTIEELD